MADGDLSPEVAHVGARYFHVQNMATVAALLDQLERYENALRYISQPTMGLPGGVDPETFAREGATDHNARAALETCIRIARKALK